MMDRIPIGIRGRTLYRLARYTAVAILMAGPALPWFPPVSHANGELAHQPLSEYRSRRERLMQQLKDGIVVLIGAREDEFGEVGRFRQKNDFMYLTGCEVPSSFLMLIPAGLIPDKPARELLFIPDRNLVQESWTGPQIGPGPEAEQKFGIREVQSISGFYGLLLDTLSSSPFRTDIPGLGHPAKLYTLIPDGSAASLTRESQFVELISKAAPGVETENVEPYLGEMRKIKSPAEQQIMQKAIDITAEAQAAARRTIRPGVFEYEVQSVVEAAFTRGGAERPGYPSIIGSGIYSTVLHYDENKKKIEDGDTVVCDVGAEYSYYTADTTRTYPASGKFTKRQREIYQLVLDAQRASEKAFKPGQTTMGDLHRAAIGVMINSPLRDSHGNTLESYFIHGVGHWLGMDVHDVGAYTRPIPVGAVFTIEPGIYIPEEKLGVRIEDNYLATQSGLIKLTEKIPSDPDEVERLMTEEPRSGMAAPSSRK